MAKDAKPLIHAKNMPNTGDQAATTVAVKA